MTQQNCSQCDKPAIAKIGNTLLCVEHYLKFQQALEIEQTRYAREEEYLRDSIRSFLGLTDEPARYNYPKTVVHQVPITYNNINVDSSVIGVINTGNVQQIDVALSHINKAGFAAIAQVFKQFSEAVIAEKAVQNQQKNEILEHISFLANQLIIPKDNRKPAVIKSVITALKESVSSAASLVTLWDKFQPILLKLFAIG